MTGPTFDAAVLREELNRDEGLRTSVYKDTRGFLTVGVGHNLSIPQNSYTIDALYQNDVNGCVASLNLNFPWWINLDPVRQRVMMSLMFNMGSGTLRTFNTFLSLMEAGDYTAAADDLKTTAWAREVGDRATRLEQLLIEG